MRGYRVIITIFILASFLLVPIKSSSAEQIVVQTDVLNVRSGPGLDYKKIDQIHSNESYKILNQKNNWLQIQQKDETGWVAKWLTKREDVSHKSYFSKVDDLRIRSKPGLHGSVKGYLKKNDQVKRTNLDGKWAYITHSNTTGWVHSDYLSAEKQDKNSNTFPQNNRTQSQKEPIGKVTVGTPTLNVRSFASTNGKVLTQIHKGNQYEFTAKKDGWYQIKLDNAEKGWVAEHLITTNKTSPSKTTYITLDYNGTNLRHGPSTDSPIIGQANKDEQFDVLSKQGNWYKVRYQNKHAFVAGSIVEEHKNENPEEARNLKGKTIMVDAGHGGKDPGAIGYSGSYEKTLTLQIAKKLKEYLEDQQATVLMTRNSDRYKTLSNRSYYSNSSNADAFISLHYNSTPNHINASGISSHYYGERDRILASFIHTEIMEKTDLKDRSVHQSDFHVLRENTKPSILLELGFISSAEEEQIIKGVHNQNQVSKEITQGIINYFAKKP